MIDTIRIDGARTRISIAPEFGGRIAQIEVLHRGTWVSLLHDAAERPPSERDAMSWGSFVMAPWPNRIALGRFPWRGETIVIPPNLGPHAGHGVCFDRAWRVDAATPTACELTVAFDQRWPFGGHAVQRIEALDDGVAQTVEVHAGDAPFPAGVGWHPWFRREIVGAEHVHALVDADERYELVDGIPTGNLLPVEGEFDLRGYPPLADRRLDDCYPRPHEPMRLRWDDLGIWMESSDNVTHAVVYTPEHAVCLEPQTCSNDAFNLQARGRPGEVGVTLVEPGRPLIASTIWRWATIEP